MPDGFLRDVQSQWSQITTRKTLTKTGAQVPDPNYPPTSRQMLQVWDAAWGKNQAECLPQMTPQQQKEYTQAYKTYLQVRQTLTAKVAAEAQAQQPKASNQSLIDEAQKAGLSPRTPGFPIEMPPAQTQPSESKSKAPSAPQPTSSDQIQRQLDQQQADRDALGQRIAAHDQALKAQQEHVTKGIAEVQHDAQAREAEKQAGLKAIAVQRDTERTKIQTELDQSKLAAQRKYEQLLKEAKEKKQDEPANGPVGAKPEGMPQPQTLSQTATPDSPENQNKPATATKPQTAGNGKDGGNGKKKGTDECQPLSPEGMQQFDGKDFDALSPEEQGQFRQAYNVKGNGVVSRKSADSGHSNFHIERGPNGERILRSGPAAKSNRDELSNETEFRKNANRLLLDEYGKDNIPPGMQTHHKVSVNSVRNGSSDLAKLLLERAKQGYKIDRDSNLKTMPGGPEAIEGGAKDSLLHRSQHPNWDNHVDEAMRKAGDAAKTQFCVENLKDLSNAQLDEVMSNVEDTLEQDLVRVNSDIKKLKPGKEPKNGTNLKENLKTKENPNGWIRQIELDGQTYFKLSQTESLQQAA